MSKSRLNLDEENEKAKGVFDTLMKQSNNLFNDSNLFNIKINETDKATKNAVRNLCVSIANSCKLGKINNVSTKHVNQLVKDMQEVGYSEKVIKDTVSSLQRFTKTIGTKKPLVESKKIFEMNGVGKRKDAQLERQWSDNEYSKMIKVAKDAGREDVVLAIKISDAFGTRLEGTMTLKPTQIERALLHGELVVTEKGGKTRHITVETNKQKKLLKEIKSVYKKDGLKSQDSIFRDSPTLNEGKKIRNSNNVGKCMKSVQNFISSHREDIQDSDRNTIKDNNGASIEKPDLSFHGLRYRNARETYIRKRFQGYSTWKAFEFVNHHLGHGKDRKDITEVYLKDMERDFRQNLQLYKDKYGFN